MISNTVKEQVRWYVARKTFQRLRYVSWQSNMERLCRQVDILFVNHLDVKLGFRVITTWAPKQLNAGPWLSLFDSCYRNITECWLTLPFMSTVMIYFTPSQMCSVLYPCCVLPGNEQGLTIPHQWQVTVHNMSVLNNGCDTRENREECVFRFMWSEIYYNRKQRIATSTFTFAAFACHWNVRV